MPNPVGWFEIPVSDMPRAKAFYERLLGIEISMHTVGPFNMGWFPMDPEGKGAMGSLVAAEGVVPSSAPGVMVYFTAPDLERTLERAAAHGGVVVHPIMDVGEYGEMAFIKDTEGNHIGLHRKQV